MSTSFDVRRTTKFGMVKHMGDSVFKGAPNVHYTSEHSTEFGCSRLNRVDNREGPQHLCAVGPRPIPSGRTQRTQTSRGTVASTFSPALAGNCGNVPITPMCTFQA